jgi:hypothetical protein
MDECIGIIIVNVSGMTLHMHHEHAAAPLLVLYLVEIPVDSRCLHVSLRVPSPIGNIRCIFSIIVLVDCCWVVSSFAL